MFRNITTLIPFLLCLAVASAEEPKPKAKDPFEEHLAQLKELSKRANGVLLRATAEVKDDQITIQWTLDYEGPRSPLIIQKPMYPGNTWNATSIRIAVRGPNSEVVSLSFVANWGGPGPAPLLKTDDYITVEKGKTATGKVSLAVADVKARLMKDFPKVSERMLPTEVVVQFLHLPTQRGEQFGLDAWTAGTSLRLGGLYSLPMKVSVNKW